VTFRIKLQCQFRETPRPQRDFSFRLGYLLGESVVILDLNSLRATYKPFCFLHRFPWTVRLQVGDVAPERPWSWLSTVRGTVWLPQMAHSWQSYGTWALLNSNRMFQGQGWLPSRVSDSWVHLILELVLFVISSQWGSDKLIPLGNVEVDQGFPFFSISSILVGLLGDKEVTCYYHRLATVNEASAVTQMPHQAFHVPCVLWLRAGISSKSAGLSPQIDSVEGGRIFKRWGLVGGF
jgi:hypothetical protein